MFKLRTPGGVVKLRWGVPSDMPVSGDWDGNGTTEVGVRRPGEGTFYPRMPDGTSSPVWLGDADDLPVTGDWNGDGVSDLGVWTPATATFTQGAGRTPTAARGVLRTVRFGNPRR